MTEKHSLKLIPPKISSLEGVKDEIVILLQRATVLAAVNLVGAKIRKCRSPMHHKPIQIDAESAESADISRTKK